MRTPSFLLFAALLGCAGGRRPAAEIPNLLFAIADDWSYGHAGAYGAAWVKTPAFDRVAREGLLFKRAYTPNAKCAPSRAIILTGLNSWQLKEACNHWCFFPPEFKGWPEALAEAGWFVGTTGKGWGPGIAKDDQGKARQMTGRPFTARKADPPAKAISNNDYAGNFEDFLAAAPKGKPWAFWYGATEPHRGYEAGSGVRAGKKLSDLDRVPAYWPDNETVRGDILDYAVEVEHFDAHLGRMVAALERAGELDRTLIVATSDHGMPFPRVKGQAYDASNRIPLAVRWPAGIAGPGRTVEDFVSFADLAPTFAELAGIPWKATGRSLADVFAGPGPHPGRDHVLIGKERHDVGRPGDAGYPIRGIVKRDLLYLVNFEPLRWPGGNPETGYLNCDGGPTKTTVLEGRRTGKDPGPWALCFGKRPEEELYDLSSDPDCVRNLAAERTEQCARLREELIDRLKAQGDPRMEGMGAVFDRYPYAGGDRGFHERFMKGEKLRAGWVSPTDFESGPLD